MPTTAPSDREINNPAARRGGIAVAYLNAGLWGLGSGLASTTLMLYLARALGASGLAISWILAAPPLAGLLRLAAPAWLERVGSRRRFCVAMFLSSAAVLTTMPIVALPGALFRSGAAVAAIGVAWTGFQLLDAIGAVALWAWLGDLAPPRIRGRVLARREAWLNAGVLAGSVAAISVAALWDALAPMFGAGDIQRQAYIGCALAGAALFAAAALVLTRMPEVSPRLSGQAQVRFGIADLVAPLVDANFRRLLVFGLWFSFSNGVVQTAQSMFVMGPLAVSFTLKRTLDGGLRGLKSAVLPSVGAAVDRVGNVRVLAASQALIAAAMLPLLLASPGATWWILPVYILWTAYAGHDVALPNLMLGLSPREKSATYAAAWFAWTQLAFSLSVLAGGAAFDWLRDHVEPFGVAGRRIDHFTLVLAAGCLLKFAGVAFARRIDNARCEDNHGATR